MNLFFTTLFSPVQENWRNQDRNVEFDSAAEPVLSQGHRRFEKDPDIPETAADGHVDRGQGGCKSGSYRSRDFFKRTTMVFSELSL